MVKATRFSRRIILFSMPAPPPVQKMFCVKVRDTVVPRFVQENALIAAGLLFFLRMHPSATEAKNIETKGGYSKRVCYQYSTFGADCGLSIVAPNSTAQVDDVP